MAPLKICFAFGLNMVSFSVFYAAKALLIGVGSEEGL